MQLRMLVCDLDNTLYDWVGFFVPSFYAMVDEAVILLNCDRDILLDDLRSVHRKHHDAEHPFALLETQLVKDALGTLDDEERRRFLDPAFKAFNSKRKQTLRLYPGVEETLSALQSKGVMLVAHTESRFFAVAYRMRTLGLIDYFSRVYCRQRPEKSFVQENRTKTFIENFPDENVIELSMHQRKPDPSILLEIQDTMGILPSECAYVGDSLTRDILMAKQANTHAIWAKYGTEHDDQLYQELVRISHWTTEEVDREKDLKNRAATVQPDYILKNSFSEILKDLHI
tara:strand:- start:200 stop:1057 length:858 start_codon:yes stop_codon:yes gene_type:complete